MTAYVWCPIRQAHRPVDKPSGLVVIQYDPTMRDLRVRLGLR